MKLKEAIAWAESLKNKWEKNRGEPIGYYFWHVAKWNDGYIVIDNNCFKRNPKFWNTVYNTKEQIIYDQH